MPFHLKKKEEKQKCKHGNKVKKKGQIRDDKKGAAEGDGCKRFSKTLVPVKAKVVNITLPPPPFSSSIAPFSFPFFSPPLQ
jgi:hypothetical protein